MRRIGFVVNPIAGMGGRVGLKGTDGKVEEAVDRGAQMRAPDRASDALRALAASGAEVDLLTYGGLMGEDEAHEAGFEPRVVGSPGAGTPSTKGEPPETTPADTRDAVRAFAEHGVDLILFVGGDGTAGDVAETLAGLDAEIPILGVPAGVKIYSEVFGVTPEAAGRVAATFASTERAAVNDIDEDEYREGEVRTELRAVVRVPAAEKRQGSKQLAGGSVEGLADSVAGAIEEGVTYVLGPGSTLGTIEEKLGVDGSPLGVDVYRDGEVLVTDASESEILAHLGEENVIIVTPIGGQGFVFGRGNQQISPDVIRQSDVKVVASRRKLDDIGVLRVDTGDPDIDEELRGWQRVRVGRHEQRLVEVV